MTPVNDDALPTVISESVLEIGACKLRCYVLSNGKRIFDADDVRAFFGPDVWADICNAAVPPK